MKIDITVTGQTALICNRFHDAAAEKASGGSSAASSAADRGTPLEIAREKLYPSAYRDHWIIPQPNLLRCLVDGGQFHKAGKKQITTQKSSIMYSCLDIEGSEIEIKHKEPWRVDTRAVRIPSTGGRILSHRPMFDDWELSFVADIDTSIVGAKLFRQIVDDAGKRIGLGDFRPQTKGPYGKFVVTRWAEALVEEAPKVVPIAA